MDISQLSQYGISAIFIYAAWKLYSDLRIDSIKREETLIQCLNKQGETMSEISITLKTLDGRICSLENCYRYVKEGVEHV